MRIGKLYIGFQKKGLVPGKTLINFLGFTVLWNSGERLEITQSYICNPDIYTVVNKVARTASYAPFKVYKIKDQKKHQLYKLWTGENATKASIERALQLKEEAYEEINDHPLNKLIQRPNPWENGRQFTEGSIGFKVLQGERFWHVVKLEGGVNDGNPYAIYNLPPPLMAVLGDGSLLGIKEYKFQLMTNRSLTIDEIIFSRYWNPDYDSKGSHLRGLSPFTAGRKLTTRSEAVLKRSVNMVSNAGSAGMLYEKPVQGFEGMTTEQAGQLKHKVNTEVLGVDNANSIAVGSGDFGYINFGLKGTEMELVNLERLTMERICSLVNVPAGLFNPDSAIRNNQQEYKKELIVSACCPELDSLRDDWNEVAKLYPDGETIYVDYDLSVYPELQEDMDKITQRNNTAWWKTPNEKRLSEYMDEHPDPLMDEIIIPSGLQLLGDIGLNSVDEALLNDGGGGQSGKDFFWKSNPNHVQSGEHGGEFTTTEYTDAEIEDAILKYQGVDFDAINNELRYDKPDKYKDIIKKLDWASKDETERDVFRGFDSNYFKYLGVKYGFNDKSSIADIRTALLGKTLRDKSFASTSFDLNVAADFARDKGNGRTVVSAIHGKKKGINVQGWISNNKTKREKEFIIKRGSKRVITDVKYSKTGKLLIFERME